MSRRNCARKRRCRLHDYGDLRAARAGYRAVGTAIEDDLDGWPVTRERLPLASRCDLALPWRSREVCGAALSKGDLRWRTTIGKNGLRCGGMGDADRPCVDVGGSLVKILATGQSERRSFSSGPTLTPRRMVSGVKKLAGDLPLPSARPRICRLPIDHIRDRDTDAMRRRVELQFVSDE